MAKQNKNKKIISGVMAAMLLSTSLPLSVAAADRPAVYAVTESAMAEVSLRSAGSALDFSFAGAASVREVGVSELIALATGTQISSVEAAYLASLGVSMRYDDSLSSSLISTSAKGDALSFKASVQTYRAYNGANVRWIPVSVTVDGKTATFSASPSGYTAEIAGLTKDKVYTATFSYQTTIEISSYALSSVVNRAYGDAQEAISSLNDYEQAKVEYDQAYDKFQNALKEYEGQYAAYQAYQAALKAYNIELASYDAYMRKVNAYEAAMAAYQTYLSDLASFNDRYAAYEAELAALPEKQAQYETYLAYLAEVQKATNKLAVLNSSYVQDSAGRTMYATLKGDTVAQVMAQKDVLVNMAGASAADIDNAGDATAVLQSLLTDYTFTSGDEARVAWYAANYTSLRDNFIKLYSSLYNLGSNVAVRRKLKQEGKWERYAQFVGQLYIISTGLDDSTTFDSSWSYDTFDIYSLIDPSQRILDDNSYAPSGSLPEKMEPVAKPVVPTAPKQPTEVKEPMKTWTEDLTHPGEAPAKVNEPKEPTLRDFTSGAPQMPAISTELQSVVDLVRAGSLTQRSGAVNDISMSFTSSFSSSASISSAPVVTFYDYDGKTVLLSLQVEKGATAVYSGTTPFRASDAQYTYVFSGWRDANGNPVSLTNVQSNISAYAGFTETLRTYSVVWNVAGETVKQTYKYGDTPNYTGKTSYRDAITEYIFTGWSPSISKVVGDAVYTAQYTERSLSSQTFSLVFKVRGETYYRTFPYGVMPSFDDFEKDYISGGYRYVFTGWSPSFETVTENTVYEANFEKTFLIPAGEDGEKSADMTVSKTAHTVTTDETVVNAVYAVREAINAGTQLVLNLGDTTITVDNAALQKMPTAAYFRLYETTGARAAGGGKNYLLSITDEAGNELSLDSEILVELPVTEAEANGGKLNAYINGTKTAVTVQDGVAYLRLNETGTIVLRPYYTVSVTTEGSGGDVTLGSTTAEAGALVTLNVYAEQGRKLETLMISVDGGAEEALTLTDGAFVMPAGDASVRAVFAETEYTVVFIVQGKEISRETYRYGEEVKVPAMDDKLTYQDASGEKTYTFSGWDSTISAVTKDMTYTAVYEEGTVGDKDNTYISDHDSNKLMTVVLPIALTILTLGIAALVCWLLYKKKGIGPIAWVKDREERAKVKAWFARTWDKTKVFFSCAWSKTKGFFSRTMSKIKRSKPVVWLMDKLGRGGSDKK